MARSLFEKYQDNFSLLNQVLDAYEPAANRIANTVAVSFVEERERIIRQQQDSIREPVANYLVRTVDASRLMGASVIITGLSPEIAQTLVTIGVDLGKMNTIGDLQGGLEEAERLLGYRVIPAGQESAE